MKYLITILIGAFCGYWLAKKKTEIDEEQTKNAHHSTNIELVGVLEEMEINGTQTSDENGTGSGIISGNSQGISVKSYRQPIF